MRSVKFGTVWKSEVLGRHYYLGGLQRPGSCPADDSWALASQSPAQTSVQRAVKGVGLIPKLLWSWSLGSLQQPPWRPTLRLSGDTAISGCGELRTGVGRELRKGGAG